MTKAAGGCNNPLHLMFETLFLAICTLACCTCVYLVTTRTARESALISRIESLEATRASTQLEVENILAQCQELLDRTEAKRRRFAATEARQRAAEAAEDEPGATQPGERGSRAEQLRLVRSRLHAKGVM